MCARSLFKVVFSLTILVVFAGKKLLLSLLQDCFQLRFLLVGSCTVTMEVTVTIMTVKPHLLVKQSQVVLMSFIFVLSNMMVLKSSPANGWAYVLCFMGRRLALKSRNPLPPLLPLHFSLLPLNPPPCCQERAQRMGPGARAGSEMVAGGAWPVPRWV